MSKNDTKDQGAFTCPIEMLSIFVNAARKTAWPYGVEGARDPEEAARLEELMIRESINNLGDIGFPETNIAATYGRYIFE